MTRMKWEMWCRRTRSIVAVFTLTSILLMMLYIAASGMDGDDHGNHGALKQWFDGLRSKKGMCCSFADGFELKDIDWDTALGPDGKSHYRVKIPSFVTTDYNTGKKVTVPASKDYIVVDDDAVITEPNRYGSAVVWPVMYNNGVVGVRCFIPGAGT